MCTQYGIFLQTLRQVFDAKFQPPIGIKQIQHIDSHYTSASTGKQFLLRRSQFKLNDQRRCASAYRENFFCVVLSERKKGLQIFIDRKEHETVVHQIV